MNTKNLYEIRFSGNRELDVRNRIWKILCESFFQKFIGYNDTVIDIAAGYCEFINNIKAARKIAVDLNPDITKYANSGIEVINESCDKLKSLPEEIADVVFISNFLEHLDSREEILKLLLECKRLLKSNGKILILQPNIRYLIKEYWDFLDHKIPLTDKSLIEALILAGFRIELVVRKFIPYTTKSRYPKFPWLVKLYIALMPISGYLFGKQSFVVAIKPSS